MNNSYRIRTQVGVDKSVKVKLEQDYEFLEILSLKFLQSEVYTRQCSDYGVVVGRVTANNGFGIPNVKVSIFIPLNSQDETNPIISSLYPYKSITDLNEDGYKYNLLPYKKSYSNHSPTGTFFDKEDILINPTLIEVYDKYYKYTVRTNDSGDFMIFGAPTGTQTLHFDIDLSDIGEFSLSPQDLIRMGIATEAQVAGTKFRSSSNLNELPQIISLNRKIEIQPLWGEADLCTLGITRNDIDLTSELSINITPTAIFMGSIFSSGDDQFQKRNCKPKTRQGELCNLVTGPGEILAIRQTIFNDRLGRPILEQYELESGGQVIDENGTWVVDVPMNLDYIITNEFGERVLSNDPQKGIPTKGKYRFKIKWNQSPKLAETLKRGYFLVPNVREYGWTSTSPDLDPLINAPLNSPNRLLAINSYSFSLDWNDYGFSGSTQGQQMIQEAINCDDRFYLMSYNKVYTVSQLIDQFRAGYLPNRTISIKNILDESCESENNKFPTNDAVARFDIIYLFFIIMMNLFKPIIYILLIVVHVLAFFLYLVGPILAILVGTIFVLIIAICNGLRYICFGCVRCPPLKDAVGLMNKIVNLYKLFTNLPIPNLTYPDCELCNCKNPEALPEGDATSVVVEETGQNPDDYYADANLQAYLSPFTLSPLYTGFTDEDVEVLTKKQQLLSGLPIDDDNPNAGSMAPDFFVKDNRVYFTNSITLAERLNLFNTKAKYFNNSNTSDPNNYPQGNNPGGGYNRIKVTFASDLPINVNKFHYDNVLAISCLPSKLSELTPGQIVSFQDPSLSSDPNLTGITSLNVYGTPSITGTTINGGLHSIQIQFANPNGNGTTATTYNIVQNSNDAQYAKFPIDVEYFQVITAMTYTQFVSQCNNSNPLSFNTRYLSNTIKINDINNSTSVWETETTLKPIEYFKEYNEQVICFLVRGVDPYSTRVKVKYDLSILFGKAYGNVVVQGDYKLNIPIQGSFKPFRHSSFISNLTLSTSEKIYFDSYHFEPGDDFSGFTTNLPSYYSALGDNDGNFVPGIVQKVNIAAPRLNQSATYINSLYGVKVRQFPITLPYTPFYQNGFTLDYDIPFGFYRLPTINSNLTAQNNKGYFQGEIIEGGSYMMQGPSNLDYPGNSTRPYLYLANNSVGASTYTPTFVSYYYAPKYNLTYQYPQTAGSSGKQIIMRTDRLPTSTSLSTTVNNSFALHTNNSFAVFLFGDDGIVTTSQSQGTGSSFGNEGDTDTELSGPIAEVLNSFQCNTLVPLGCYTSTTSGEISIIEDRTDECYTQSNRPIMTNGCYVLVTKIFTSLLRDFKLLAEWFSRITTTFGACRNVWSHIFTNNWINGSLYAFAFKNDRFFTSPFTNPIEDANKPFSVYCRKTLILHPTNNFYYRSSPYNITSGTFVGAPRLDPPDILGFSQEPYGGNIRLLNFPTTIMDLGPRSQYLQELVMADDFDGYVINELKSTTYTDVSEILNLLILSRLVNTNFIQQLIGVNGAGINNYFDKRSKRFVDGDYAQLISISSELGISDFESQNYPSRIGQDPIYFNNADSSDAIIGIFFSSDTQVRDFISPKRTIIDQTLTISEPCASNDFNVFTQRVPFYQWAINPNEVSTNRSIFGSQTNNWFTDTIDGNQYFDHFYQTLDRANRDSRYFRSNNSLISLNYKGYIYQQEAPPSDELSISTLTIDSNSFDSRLITVGAPFYFYFGLKKGKTAWDRFAKKWIKFDIITD